MLKRRMLVVLFYLFVMVPLFAQGETDTTSKPKKNEDILLPNDYMRNTVKWNITPFLIWSYSDINLSYERVLSPYRTFSVNVGWFVLPSTSIYDSLQVVASRNRWGFTVSGDYRYYFKKRNKNFAPDGLYWGPFGSFHYTGFENDILVFKTDGSRGNLNLNAQLGILSAGVELGYQFVLNDHFTIDLVFAAPALSVYMGKLQVEGDLELDEENEYIQAISDMLSYLFPGVGDALTGEKMFKVGGYNAKIGMGARYLIQVGYRF